MGAYIDLCFNGTPGPIFHWIKIKAAGRPYLLGNMGVTEGYKFTNSSFIVTSALIWQHVSNSIISTSHLLMG